MLAALAYAERVAVAQETPQQATGEAASNVSAYDPAFFTEFRPNTAMDMITRIPGFSFDGGSSARGFSGTAGNVLIDGQRPPSRGDPLAAVISRIPASGVQRIDIIRGGAEGIDMQGRSIIANIIRKPDAGLTGAISAGTNVNDKGDVSPNASVQLRRQAGGDLLEGSLGYNRGENTNEGERLRVTGPGAVLLQGRLRGFNKFERIGFTGAWETTWLGGSLRINGLAGAETFEYRANEVLIVPGGGQFNGGIEENTEAESGVRYTRSFAGGYGMELVGFQSIRTEDNDGVFNTPSFTSATRTSSEAGESIARATLTLPKILDVTVEGGGEMVFNYSESSNERVQNGSDFDLAGDTSRVEELRSEGFATATWAPTNSLSIETGARYEWSRISADTDGGGSEKTLTFFKPRLNLSWAPARGHQVGARIERIVDQLNFDSFASSANFENEIFGVGNPEVEPEKNWTASARYERQFGGQNSLVFSYTHTKVEDVLGRTVIAAPTPTEPDREVEITQNTGEATRDELELSGVVELDGIGVKGGLFSFESTLRTSNVTDPVTGEERAISNVTPFSWNVSLQQTLANGDFRWSLFLEDDSNTKSWSPRQVSGSHGGMFIGANITWKPLPGWTFGAGLNNWLAEDFEGYSVLFDAPRSRGLPLWLETRKNYAKRNAFVNVRKDF